MDTYKITGESHYQCRAVKAERDKLRAALLESAAELRAAAELIEHWGMYADKYDRDKYGLSDDIERISNAAFRFEGIARLGDENEKP